MKNSHTILLLILSTFLASCLNEQESAELILHNYITTKENQFKEQEKKESLMFWEACLSGDESDYEKVTDAATNFQAESGIEQRSFQIDKFKKLDQKMFSDKKDLQFLTKMKKSGVIEDSILKRQLDVIYLKILGGEFKADKYKKLVQMQMDIWHQAQYKTLEIDSERYTDSQIDSLRKASSDAGFFKKVFDARREYAKNTYSKIISLIKLRNEFAKECGFNNYYELLLTEHELQKEQISNIIFELDTITDESYQSAKQVIDKFLAKRFNIQKEDLMPWHYVDERHIFFPVNFSKRLDELLKGKDIVSIASNYYKQLGLDVSDILDASIINSPKIMSQKDYFICIDYQKDMRIMANVRSDMQGLKIIMHLLSHAVFYKNVSHKIPYSLVYPNLILTEGVADYFSNRIINYDWIEKNIGIEPKDTSMIKVVCRHTYQLEKLFKSRTVMALAVFEQKLYEDPEQDLGELWWDINNQYLGFDKPSEIHPYDWAINDYFLLTPGTGQANLLADIFASQLENHLCHELKVDTLDVISCIENQKVGELLKNNFFKNGNVLPWNKLIKKATGEQLTATYYYESIANLF
ncbi:hypothetical protein ACUNWD_20550 [Sunxiuqinia sp. A32]